MPKAWYKRLADMLTSRFGAHLRNSKWNRRVRLLQPRRALPPDEPSRRCRRYFRTNRRCSSRSAFQKKAGDLVVVRPDAVQQVLHPRGGVADPEMLLDPGPHLLGVVEAPLGDLLLELLDLGGSQPTGVAVIVQGTQLVQALVAEDAEPVPDLAAGDAQQLGHLFPGASFVDPEEGGQPLEDAAVAGLPSPLLDLLTLLGTQHDGLHRSPPDCETQPHHGPYLGSTRIIVGSSGTSRLYVGSFTQNSGKLLAIGSRW